MREGSYWMLHLFAGLVVLVFLGIHMFIMHLEDILAFLGTGYKDPISFSSVLLRGKQAFFMVTYIVLLGAALYHGLYGLRTLLFELTLKEVTEKIITWVVVIIGLLLFVMGTYAAVATFVMKLKTI